LALTEKERLTLQNALEQIQSARSAMEALCYSYEIKPDLAQAALFSQADWEHWDAFTVRFSRLADILTKKVFRALDKSDFLENQSSFIDRIFRAEKRQLIADVTVWKQIRELRNQLVHEYANENLIPLLRMVEQLTPELIACTNRLDPYKNILLTRLQAE
jgi:hypothetical protein